MDIFNKNSVEHLVVDTTAFIQNAQLQSVGKKIVTIQEVVDEITSKRQIRRLVVLPYDLEIKNVFPENVAVITEFSKKTGDFPSLSATDIKVMALTYQLEKEQVGTDHLRTEPIVKRAVNVVMSREKAPDMDTGIAGFYVPGQKTNWVPSRNASRTTSVCSTLSERPINLKEQAVDNSETILEDEVENSGEESQACKDVETHDKVEKELEHKEVESKRELSETDTELSERFGKLDCADINNTVLQEEEKLMNEILTSVKNTETLYDDADDFYSAGEEDDDNDYSDNDVNEEDNEGDEDAGWITPSNVKQAKKQMGSKYVEEKQVKVACMTTDFAMQNVLKQMNLNVATLDGRMIKQLRTFILRCYTCFKTTSIMTKTFCPGCGNQTLKRVAVSLDENGKQIIHINGRKPLTARGKKFSLPTFQGGKHANNPILVADQPVPDNRPSRLAKMKNDPLDDAWIAGYSPFVMRDVTSKSAMLGIKPKEVKHWMKKNPNEARRKRK